jgi:hypothetical protein
MLWFRVYREIITDPKLKRVNAGQRWLWLCLLALGSDSEGLIRLAHCVGYTESELADMAGIAEKEASEAIEWFSRCEMIEVLDNGEIQITKWKNRQFRSDDSTERVRKHRAKRFSNNDETLHDGYRNAPETEQNRDRTETEHIPFVKIQEHWNETVSHVKIRSISGKRKANVKARVEEHGLDSVLEAIIKVEASDFLTGRKPNEKGWTCTPDWVFKPTNMPKILEGHYDNRESSGGNGKGKETHSTSRLDEFGWHPEDYAEHAEHEQWVDYTIACGEEFGWSGEHGQWPRFEAWRSGTVK